jgi:hypothetical protein
MLAAILAIAAIAFVVNRMAPETPAPAGETAGPGAAMAPDSTDAVAPAGATPRGDGAVAPGSESLDPAEDPHRHIPDPEQVSVSLPIQPVPDQNGPRRDGQTATAPGQPGSSGSDAPGISPGMPAPAASMGQGPVATENAGAPPEAGGSQSLGTGPAGEPSGVTDIEPVALGPEVDPTATLEPNADLGPAPEASDPGTMGPAPEDSGEE